MGTQSDRSRYREQAAPSGGEGLIPAVWKPPEIWLDPAGKYVCWSSSIMGSERRQNEPVPPTGMLERFLNIKTADDVLRFAAKYGVLALCQQHGWPSTHRVASDEASVPSGAWSHETEACRWESATTQRHPPTDYQEPVARWLEMVAEARRAVLIANYLIGEQDPWARAATRSGEEPTLESVDLPRDPLEARQAVEETVNKWLRWGVVRPTLIWDGGSDFPNIHFGGNTFAGLALQLAFEVSRTRALVACSGCGSLYRRRLRAPKAGQANYCDECREKGAGLLFRKRRQNRRLPK